MTRVVWLYGPEDEPPVVLAECDSPDGQNGAVFHVAPTRELAAVWAGQLQRGLAPAADPGPSS